jgi:hypothetical protein
MVNQKPHGQAHGVPTACDQSTKSGVLRLLWIYVKGLRIEAPGEFDYLSFPNGDGTELVNGSGQIILEIPVFLWSCECHVGTKTPYVTTVAISPEYPAVPGPI